MCFEARILNSMKYSIYVTSVRAMIFLVRLCQELPNKTITPYYPDSRSSAQRHEGYDSLYPMTRFDKPTTVRSFRSLIKMWRS
jgi:hypothetical protein